MSADFSPAFSAWVDALEYVNDLTTKELLCMNEAWDAALEWERCRRIDELRRTAVTKPHCDCPGPWCEGRDRDFPVRCLGYQIDSDGGAA